MLVLCCFCIMYGLLLILGDIVISKVCYVLLVVLDILEVVWKLDEYWILLDIGCLEGELVVERWV